MAIQFFCVACRQPIEVDDVMANQTVTCPYCHKVVTAPAASEVGLQESSPVARTTSSLTDPAPMEYATPIPQRPNTLSWVALGCTSLSLIIYAVLIGTAISIAKGVGPNATPAEAQKRVQQEIQKRPGMQALSIVGSCVAPVIGIISGIVALVRRTPPRWPAVTALVFYGLVIMLSCLGFVFAISTAGGKPGG